MTLNILGIEFVFSSENIYLALLLTFAIFMVRVIVKVYKAANPFKKDRISNDALMFFWNSCEIYTKKFQSIEPQRYQNLRKSFRDLRKYLDLRVLEYSSYRSLIQPLMHNYREDMMELYDLFYKIKRTENQDEIFRALDRAERIISPIRNHFEHEIEQITKIRKAVRKG